MTPIEEVKARLVALGTLGTIKIGPLPPSPDVICVLKEYAGRKPERRFGVLGIGYEYPAIQVLFRGAPDDYLSPRNLAEIAYRNLASVQPGRITPAIATQYLMVDPQQSPSPILAQDKEKRHIIGFNIYIMKEPS